MLKKLEKKHGDKKLTLICEDYFVADMGETCFDCAVSFESLHHFTQEKKQTLYKKIFQSLKQGGAFYKCDYIACCLDEEEILMAACKQKRKNAGVGESTFIHFDTPLTLAHEIEAMELAGFINVRALFSIQGATLIVAEKPSFSF